MIVHWKNFLFSNTEQLEMSVDLPQTEAAVYLTMQITHEYQLFF